ncbi:bifunctional non-homologous end joining protein LigD [Povalibacter uvarum]|uniref:DNA ligase (ATP) n=1 Tax=Povalibacter uvarum TaxID=732238 RepID=A0A841HUX5_9GAMM|nr:non-homologous end-joining DNA ligase [Povalibacter uvarum]MBB6096059.1 bifunctional non-homologous end joining protein LigD [Povalibacter uvarum]
MKRPLEKYAQKRKFTKTPEPGPKVVTRTGPLLFIVQKHAARRLHYDFRLELDGVLKSWAVPKGPSLQPGEKRLAVEVEDHPFDYASFEGVIPEKEYGAGNVIVWDCGVYSPDEGSEYSFGDREEAEERLRRELANGKLSIFLRGEKLKGSFALVRTTTDKQWLLIKHKDRFVGPDTLLAQNTSVLSGATLDEIAAVAARERFSAGLLAPAGPAESLPRNLSPMLAESGDEDPMTQADWSYEPKLDGYRVLAYIDNGEVFLQSRRGIDLTPMFPEVVEDLQRQCIDTMLLDGEIVALDGDGRPSFHALQNRAQRKSTKELTAARRENPVIFLCFDLLHFAGMNLRGATYEERRRYLTQCLLPSAHVQLIHTSDNAEQMYGASLASGFEGIVAKRRDSVYQPGKRAATWVKYKSTRTGDFVVGGYTEGRGGRGKLGALLLGYYKNKQLHYVGHSGSGFTDQSIKQFLALASTLETKESPFVGKPPLNAPATWLTPDLVAEIQFDAWTPDGHLRSPVFLRLRDDIEAKEVRSGPDSKPAKTKAAKTPANDIERVVQQLDNKSQQLELVLDNWKLRLTNLDREYWPGDKSGKTPPITKREYLRYLARVSPFMLPHLRDRPLTMIRMPEGIDGERFFQKHWEQAKPEFVETVSVFSEHKEGRHEYVMGNNLPTLLWLGQIGTLEFHIWHSRAKVAADSKSKSTDYDSSIEAMESSVLNYPDYLVFDIDPYIYSGKEAKGAEPELNKKGFAVGKRVAFWINDLLKEMSLTARVKTSGKTGLHVFVPIERTVTFDEARHICEMVGRHVMQAHPKEVTMEWAVVKRTGKIFIDYNMNVRGKTLNVAYSPRGVPGAPISMPLTWEELEAAEPGHFTLRNVLDRLEKAGDRWHDVLSIKQNLAKVFGSKR